MHTYYDIWNWQPDRFSEVTIMISFQKKKIKIKIKFPNEEWVKDLGENYPK
jgi:hypothetical protein